MVKKNLMFVKNYEGEVNNEPSVTKQGQASSVQEILKRFGYYPPNPSNYEFDSRVDGSDLEATEFDGDLDDELIDVSEAVRESEELISQSNEKAENKERSADKVSEQTSPNEVQDASAK